MKQRSEQEITIFQLKIVNQTVSAILFLPSTLNEWFRLDINTRNSESISVFKIRLLSFIHPYQSNIFNIFDPIGLKLLTRSRLGLSHLNEHKFRHNFHDRLNPLVSCSLEIEDTTHYLVQCQHFSNYLYDLMNSVKSIIPNFESLTHNNGIDILLCGDSRFDENKNKIILEETINYLKNSNRFFWVLFRIKSSLCGDFPFETFNPITFKPLFVGIYRIKSHL